MTCDLQLSVASCLSMTAYPGLSHFGCDPRKSPERPRVCHLLALWLPQWHRSLSLPRYDPAADLQAPP